MAKLRYALGDQADGRFSDEYLQANVPNAAVELRSRAKGVLLLCALIRELRREVEFRSETGVYLYSRPGSSNARVQEIAAREAGAERLHLLERALPPKDFFLANPAMHAAQLSLEFALHGPWMTFHTPLHGLAHACHYAAGELRDGTVPAALIAALEMLEEPQPERRECLFVQYVTRTDEIVWPGAARLDQWLEGNPLA